MNYLTLVVAFLLVSGTAISEEHHSSTHLKPAVLMSGLGQYHHPVSTKNAEAQRFFDQGLTFIYAFNHDEAIRSFKRAAELDPNLAMAYWGMALALGPNINLPVDPEREKAAYETVQKALELSKNAPEQERAYIEALAKRYSIDPKADLYKLAVDYKDAIKTAWQLETNVGPIAKEMPMVEFVMPTSTLILVRFNRWDDILKSPKPDPNMLITTAVWHFARGMAYAATGKVADAESEQKLFIATKTKVPSDTMWDLNSASSVLGIAENILDAKIAITKGDKKSAIELLRKAVEAEDALNYTEPPGWYIPVRKSLGGVLLISGDYAETEKVFRADLEKNPRSGRSLFGLMESLKAQGKTYDAQMVQREFETAWRNADTKLRVGDL
ncbi:MAG: hypothetical protein HYW01_06510 [Deltaproteobacteria bacterium]|nr:hypothetical protein [Deltaproteobacteria bacterium]